MENHETNLLSLINISLEVAYCSRYCLIIVQLVLKESSYNYIWDCRMGFVNYSHLILLISSLTFEITVAL